MFFDCCLEILSFPRGPLFHSAHGPCELGGWSCVPLLWGVGWGRGDSLGRWQEPLDCRVWGSPGPVQLNLSPTPLSVWDLPACIEWCCLSGAVRKPLLPHPLAAVCGLTIGANLTFVSISLMAPLSGWFRAKWVQRVYQAAPCYTSAGKQTAPAWWLIAAMSGPSGVCFRLQVGAACLRGPRWASSLPGPALRWQEH